MKKRIIALLLALLMLTSAGCGSAPAAKEPADEEPALGAYQALSLIHIYSLATRCSAMAAVSFPVISRRRENSITPPTALSSRWTVAI